MKVAGIVALGILACWPASALAQQWDTDRTVPIARGGRIEVNRCRGTVTIRTWNRDEVRVRANHMGRADVRVASQGQVVVIGTAGPPQEVDYEITVPASSGARLEGLSCAADIEGLSGPVSVNTVESSVTLRGIAGTAEVSTIEGDIDVQGGRGQVHVHSVNGTVIVRDAAGEIAAGSVDGDVRLTNVKAKAVEVSTIDGDVEFRGIFDPAGRFRFTTHDGDVLLAIPASTDATLGIRTFEQRAVSSAFPLTVAAGSPWGRRQVYTLGSGSATVEVETFDGHVRIERLE